MKVLITGASGNVGSAVSRGLHEAGLGLVLTDRKFRRDLSAPVQVANLLDREAPYRLMEGCEAVVHLGNHPVFGHSSDAQTLYGENCTMNMNVVQAAKEMGVRKFIFISSIQVINGDRLINWEDETKSPPSMLPYLPVDCDTPANPRNPYSQSKRAGEILLEHYLAPAGTQCVAIRLPWCAGGDWWTRLKSHYGDNVNRFAQLDEAFACLHNRDLTSLILAILQTDLPGFRIYLPAAESPSVSTPIPRLVERFFSNVPLRTPATELSSLIDTSRITRETGWRPKWSLAREDPK